MHWANSKETGNEELNNAYNVNTGKGLPIFANSYDAFDYQLHNVSSCSLPASCYSTQANTLIVLEDASARIDTKGTAPEPGID
jgi:hypothetical protein